LINIVGVPLIWLKAISMVTASVILPPEFFMLLLAIL